METFALFGDGTSGQIVLGFLEFMEPEDLPLKLIPLNLSDNQVNHSAQNGFYAGYQVLKGLGFAGGEKYCISYQFREQRATFYALGESAGLAFCLKFAQEIYQRERGRPHNYSIAATGVISDGTEKAQVRGVAEINAKLKEAVTCLNKGDRIFYPYVNEYEYGLIIQEDASRSGIELIPVSTVEQAIKKLLEKSVLEEYPVEIEGLEKSVSIPGVYHFGHRLHLGRKIKVPFKVANKGNLNLTVTVRGQDSVADWVKLSFAATPLLSQEERLGRIDIPSRYRSLFFLRHSFRFSFQKEGELSLCFHIPQEEPYDLTKNIRVRVRFLNIGLIILPIIALLSYAGYKNQLFQRISWQLFEAKKRMVSWIIEPSVPKSEKLIPQLISTLERGRYLDAKAEIESFLKHSSTNDERIVNLYHQIIDKLNIKAASGFRVGTPIYSG